MEFHIGTENEINKSKRHPAFEITNLDAARKYLKKFNGPVNEDIQVTGQKRFSVVVQFDFTQRRQV